MKQPFKIIIASPRFLISNGIASFFSVKGFEVKMSPISQDGLERLIMNETPDFVLIDDKEDVFKIEKTIAFLSFTKPAKSIVLSDSLQQVRFQTLSKVGVKHFISSTISEAEMHNLIEAIIQDQPFEDSKINHQISFNPQEEFKNICADLNISEREVEIIKLIAEGFINKEIADKLFLSTHTVNTHRKNIMNKLGVSNATGIVIFAVKEKLISPKDFLFSSKH